jgi:TRAP-type C4-dicarboxylate transport system permease small subunit
MNPKTQKVISAADCLLSRIEQVFSAAGYLCLAFIVVFVMADIIGRQLGYPLTYSVELTSYLQVVMMFLCGAYTLRLGQHIRAELFVKLLSRRGQWGFWFVTEFVSLIVLLIITMSCWELAIGSYKSGVISTSSLKMPLGIPQIVLSVGISLFTVEAIVVLIRGIAKCHRGEGVDWIGS